MSDEFEEVLCHDVETLVGEVLSRNAVFEISDLPLAKPFFERFGPGCEGLADQVGPKAREFLQALGPGGVVMLVGGAWTVQHEGARFPPRIQKSKYIRETRAAAKAARKLLDVLRDDVFGAAIGRLRLTETRDTLRRIVETADELADHAEREKPRTKPGTEPFGRAEYLANALEEAWRTSGFKGKGIYIDRTKNQFTGPLTETARALLPDHSELVEAALGMLRERSREPTGRSKQRGS